MQQQEERDEHDNREDHDDGLRGRLVRAGVELVDAEGAQALSLREIARRAGVSHGAPRRYFPTHLDLLSAIARQGFAELADRLAEEDREEAGARERIAILARVYLAYAGTRRGMYELMFRHDLLESGRLGLRETSLPLFAHLTELVDRATKSGREAVTATGRDAATNTGREAATATGRDAATKSGRDVATATGPTAGPSADAVLRAGALWANLHGIAQLWHWGSLGLATGGTDPAPLLAAALDAHLGPAEVTP
ncbi:TetR/AcrR family transcriptional regulator [Streptomyces sp. WAC01280]|uniref:TetR/AcrR family transcriptional regulator n=1 Tax=Streptomyces sp. WAC01280 TaxID=2487424 RepID=UPI000F7B9C6B|nr:TetR/AcrR family transcriptional regulator [Streptomyces sp. WAC01280]RSS58563.1 TetR/AcrR family transcriptional regulator [Streptomyces sp. WAC01280]